MPKAGPISRLKNAPRDQIPVSSKTPRRQKSSRFYTKEKIQLERTPGFNGKYDVVKRIMWAVSSILMNLFCFTQYRDPTPLKTRFVCSKVTSMHGYL